MMTFGTCIVYSLRVFRFIALLIGASKWYFRVVSYLIRRTDLFDANYYNQQNHDVAASRVSPRMHYVKYGDKEGRSPLPIFDPVFYSNQFKRRLPKDVNRLLHYSLVGRYCQCSPSPWFDIAYYLSTNKDVARSGMDPLLHFLKFGGREGRSPSHRFDSAFYLKSYLDEDTTGINPLLHYLAKGQVEGLSALPSSGSHDSPKAEASMPPDSVWDLVSPVEYDGKIQVDIIIPVYKGMAETMRCIYNVLRYRQYASYELIVINDASPDAELTAYLRRLADRSLFTLIENKENRGFVQTVNIGMRLHSDRDVVLLNSDAEVFNNWLDRLLCVAHEQPNIGTITPMSNNATICSYPDFNRDNPYLLELPYEELDLIAAKCNGNHFVDTPTAVGFCMYIKRRCLSEVGYFDEKSFGRGYGEENDFCQRACRLGWHSVISTGIFVRHWGSTSFLGEKSERITHAMKMIQKKHPGYQQDVARFIAADPLLDARSRMDFARLQRATRQENILLVSHNRGGGTERHVKDESLRLLDNGVGVFYLRPGKKPAQVSISCSGIQHLPNIPTYDFLNPAELIDALHELNITEIHIHHLIDWAEMAPQWIMEIAKALNVKYQMAIHDYTAICPRVNLVDSSGIYCGEPDAVACNQCLKINGSDFDASDIVEWRQRYANLFSKADKLIVPDEDVKLRLSAYYTNNKIEVVPHENDFNIYSPPVFPVLDEYSKLRIVVIGAISRIKGYDVLFACAKDAQARLLPLEFVVFGYSQNDLKLRSVDVVIAGRYLDEDADEKLKKIGGHIAFLPSIWPETYSYTLSLAVKSGLPVVAFSLGAIENRLVRLGLGQYLMDISSAQDPQRINSRLMEIRATFIGEKEDKLIS